MRSFLFALYFAIFGIVSTEAAKAAFKPPTNLTATSIASSSVTLAWMDNSGSEKDEVVSRSLKSSSGFADIATVPAHTTTYTDATTAASTKYYYKVSSVSSSNKRATSSVIGVTTLPVTVTDYTLTTSASPSTSGTTTGGGTYAGGSTVTATATASSTNDFEEWTENGTVVSTSAAYTFTITNNLTLVANFTPDPVITTQSSPSAGGTTTGGGNFHKNATANVIASPNAGYTFVNWTLNGTVVSTSASYSFTVTSNETLVANFSAIASYTISTSSSPTAGGSTSGGGSYASGANVTVTATPSSCYTFANWTVNGTVVSSSSSYSFPASATETLVANFTQVSYTITTSASTGGTASGGGSKACGSSVTVTATPNSGYSFVNWTQNGTVVSTSASYTFTASASVTLIANFSALPTYTISTSSSPTAGGSTSGGGNYTSGANVTVIATPASCYTFANWTVNGTVVSSSSSYSFTASATETLVANFTQVSYTITTSASTGGTASGGGSKACGSSVTVTATPNSGYNFVNWTQNGTVVSTSASYTFTASASVSLIANFSALPTYTVSTSSSPTAGGSTSGGGNYTSGANVTVTATPASCYTFANWTVNGTVVSTSSSYSFTASATETVVANFTQTSYTITTSASTGGTASGGGSKACGSSVTVTATPNSGYNFVNWTQNGTVVSTSASYTFTASASVTLVANFSLTPPATISTSSSPTAGGSTSGGGSYTIGSTATLTASANSCYTFANWTVAGLVVSTSSTYSFLATVSETVVANFTAMGPYTITTSASTGGTASGGGTYGCGSSVTVTATPDTCHTFANWTVNGTVVSTSSSYSFTATGSETVVANFTQISYTITTSASTGGTASGGGTYACGTGVTVTATPNSGYSFVNWTQNGTVVSTSASYTYTPASSATLVANFSAAPTCTISTSSSPSAGGSTGGGGTYASNATVTVNATVNSGYTFQNWTHNGTVMSTSASYSFPATATETLMANFATSSTSGQYLWSDVWGSTLYDSGLGIAVDHRDNSVLVTGYYVDNYIFLAKYSATGSNLWTDVYPGGEGQAVAVDGSGNVFLTGYIVSTVNFGTGSLPSTSASDIFVAKFTSAGTCTWSERFGTNTVLVGGTQSGFAIATDTNGDEIVGGAFSGTVSFGTHALVSSGQYGFALKLSGSNGTVQWAISTGSGSVRGVAADSGLNAVITGTYYGTVNFGGGPLTSGNADNAFLAKYTSNGAYVWAYGCNGNGTGSGNAIAVDSSNNVFVGGSFVSMITFAGGPTNTASLGATDGFLAKYSSAGAYQWSKQFAGSYGMASVNGVATDGNGNIAIVGDFEGSITIGTTALNEAGNEDIFLAKYSPAGVNSWAKDLGGSGSTAMGYAVACDGNGDELTTGWTQGPVNFGGGLTNCTNCADTSIYVAGFGP